MFAVGPTASVPLLALHRCRRAGAAGISGRDAASPERTDERGNQSARLVSTESMSEVASVEATLWDAANQLRPNLDAAERKHIVLGLIFLEYGSDVFNRRERELAVLVDDTSDYYMPTRKPNSRTEPLNRGTYRPGVLAYFRQEPGRSGRGR